MLEWLQRDQETASLISAPASSPLLSKLRKALIESFTLHHRKSSRPTTGYIINILLGLVSVTQALSLVFREKDEMEGYEDLKGFFGAVNVARFDTIAVEMGGAELLFYLILVAVYGPIVILISNTTLLLSCKRHPVASTIRVMITTLNLLEQVLFLPSLVLSLSYIKYTFFLPDIAAMPEYGNSEKVLRSGALAGIAVVTVPVMVAAIYVNSYFFYENVLVKRKTHIYAMSSSFVHRFHILGRVLMVLCFTILAEFYEKWYRLGIALICGMLFLLYQDRATYYNNLLNVQNASKKAIIVWGVVAYYAGIWAKSAGAIVTLILFVSPVIVALVYIDAMKRMENWRMTPISDISSPYQLGLKLRCLLLEYEVSSPAQRSLLHSEIKSLFEYGTLRFSKSPLIVLWEANYYFYSRKDSFLASFKLSKMQMTDRTIEADFFVAKSLKKFTNHEESALRAYLKYLKMLEKAKRLDEHICLGMFSLCSELLSRRPNPAKCELFVSRLYVSLHRATKKYLRILELYPDNQPVLRLLGNLLNDVMKEDDGNNFLRWSRLRRGSDRSLTGNFIAELTGMVVVSCAIGEMGVISLANQKAESMLKIGNAGELTKKDISLFLHRDFAKVKTSILSNLALLDFDLAPVSQLFSLLITTDGLIAPFTTTVQATTWNNLPYLLLSLKESTVVECKILVNSAWQVLTHSALDLLREKDECVSAEDLHIHSLLPRFLTQYKGGTKGEYTHDNGEEFRVTVETISIVDPPATLVTLTRKSDELLQSIASTESLGRQRIEADKKEVRFGSGEKQVRTMERRTSAMIATDPHESAIFSDTEARVRRKFNITSSLQSSVFTGKSIDLHDRSVVIAYSNRMKLLLFVSFLITISGVVGSLIFITELLTSLTSIEILHDYSRRNELVLELAYDTRSLLLSDAPGFSYSPSDLSDSLLSKVNELNLIVETMKKRVSSEPSEVQSRELGSQIATFIRIGDRISFEMTSLIEALMRLSLSAKRLSSTDPPFTDSADAFYIARNAVAEILENLNETITVVARSDQDARLQSMTAINILVIICFVLLVAPLSTLVAPQIWLFERLQQKLWVRIYTIPRESLIEARNIVQDRLQTEFYNEQMAEPSAAKDRSFTPQATRVWLKLVVRLLVYIVISGVLLLVIEFAFVTELKDLAVTIPNYTYWSGMRPQLIAQGMFWARENQLILQGAPLPDLVREGTYWFSPQERVKNATASIDFINKVLNFGFSEYGVFNIKKSESYLKYLYENACVAFVTQECLSTAANYGSIYELKDWKLNLIAELRQITEVESADLIIRRREALSEMTRQAVTFSVDYYHIDAIAQINTFKKEIMALCISYCLGVLLLYAFLYAPAITRVKVRTLQGMQLHRVLAVREK